MWEIVGVFVGGDIQREIVDVNVVVVVVEGEKVVFGSNVGWGKKRGEKGVVVGMEKGVVVGSFVMEIVVGGM